MAKRGQQIDELYISLGLDIARLQLDFDTAGQTVSQAIARLSSKANKIQLKMDTDVSKLEGVGTELDKLKVKHEAINRQLDVQRQKEQILAAVLRDAQKNSGVSSGTADKAEKDLLKQQRLIAQTEAEVRRLQKAMREASGKIKIEVQTKRVREAERNIQDSIARMNAKIQNIRLKAEIDTSSMKGANAEIEKQRANLNALNRELSVQYQKLVQLSNAYRLQQKYTGNGSTSTISAQADFLRQQQAVKSLEADIKRLNGEISKTGSVAPTGFGKLSAAAGKVKSKIEGAVNSINSLNATIIAGASALSGAMGLFKLSEAAMKGGHETYKLANRLHTTTAEAAQLKRAINMVDGDVTMMIPVFARLGKQALAAGENGNALTDAAERYGFTLTQSSGKLLPYTKMLDELAKGYKNAAAAGDSAAFTAEVLGARGTALEALLADYDLLLAAARDVQATGLADPQMAEAAYRELKKMEFEVLQLKGAMGNALMPITRELMPEVVDGMKTMVRFIGENKESLKDFGILAGSVFGGMAKAVMTVVTALGEMRGALDSVTGGSETEKILKANGYGDLVDRGKTTGTIIGGMLGARFGGAKGGALGAVLGSDVLGGVYNQGVKWAAQLSGDWDGMKMRAALLEQEKHVVEEFNKSKKALAEKTDGDITEIHRRSVETQERLEKMLAESTNERLKEQLQSIKEKAEESIAAGTSEAKAWQDAEKDIAKAVKDARKEAEKANKELEESIYRLSHNDFQNQIYDADKAADDMRKRGANEELIAKETELRKQKLQLDFQRDVADQVNALYKTDLQNRLDAIDREKQTWVQKGLDEVEATNWAEASKAKAMQEWENSVASSIDSIWKTELQNRLVAIDREKQAWIQKGLDEVRATKWAEQQKLDAKRNAAIQAIRDQKEEMEVYRQEGQRGLIDYLREKNGITQEDLRFTPQQLEDFQAARQSAMENLLPNFRSPEAIAEEQEQMKQSFRIIADGIEYGYDEIMGKLQSGMQKLADTPIPQVPSANETSGDKAYTDARHVEVTVNIENAVTQDNEGMRILADHVADRIQPAVVNALGGDSNSYSNW